jgi:transaldolase
VNIFLDSANLNDIDEALARGFISGVTTNPSILAREPKANFFEHIGKIADKLRAHGGNLSLSAEVFATKPDEMIDQAIEIYERIAYPNLAIKVPIGWDELKVIAALVKRNIPINCTCMFTEAQAILAADAGATFVSIFMGRLKDIGGNPIEVIANTREILDKNGSKARIIVGSVRTPSDAFDAHLAGGHIVTCSLKTYKDMSWHPQTVDSVSRFMKDFAAWIS